MKKKVILIAMLSVSFVYMAFGQDREKYAMLINEAWKLYENEEYLKSAQKYSEAFVALDNHGITNDRYNAACSWALAGQIDSSFIQLFEIAQNGNYTNLGHITTDTDFDILHQDKRWNEIIDLVKANKDKAEAILDKPLVAMLDTIYFEDQTYRKQSNQISAKYGWNSKEVADLWATINEKDSVNLIKIKKIVDERGWLGPDIIGNQGNSTLFLVIQHSDLATQEKYLPMMREAVEKGNADAANLALLEDRVALRQGKRQIYGSQIGGNPETGYYVLSLEDPDNVDKRRASVGLGKIQDYVSHFGMTWDVGEYKKQLPEIEAKQKK